MCPSSVPCRHENLPLWGLFLIQPHWGLHSWILFFISTQTFNVCQVTRRLRRPLLRVLRPFVFTFLFLFFFCFLLFSVFFVFVFLFLSRFILCHKNALNLSHKQIIPILRALWSPGSDRPLHVKFMSKRISFSIVCTTLTLNTEEKSLCPFWDSERSLWPVRHI